MASSTSAGTSLRFSAAAPATFDLAGYAALYASMDLVGKITDMGEYDRVYTLITTLPLAQRRASKYKGSYDEGSLSLTLDIDPVDVGQIALRTARDSDADGYFAITHQDGSVDYFAGLVMGASKVIGGTDNMYTSNATVEINSDILVQP